MSNSSTEFFVGVDLGDAKHAVCVLNDEGEAVRQESVSNDEQGILDFAQPFPNPKRVTVAMETGTHSPWISRLLQGLGFYVLVGNTRKLRAIWDCDNKSDVRDAEMLARMARFDRNLLNPITHRGKVAHMDLAVLKARDALVKNRSNLVNFVRGTLKTAGVRLPKCSAETFTKVVRKENTEELLWEAITPVLEIIDTLSHQIRRFDHRIAEHCSDKYPETERLRQVAGVGPVTALAFVLALESPERFKKSRHVGPYLGLVPKRDQSGQCDKPLSITKAGNVYLRRLLVGAANYIMGPFGPDCDLRRYGDRIASREGKVARRKAKVAVARKLAVLLHRLWKDGELYQPIYKKAKFDQAA